MFCNISQLLSLFISCIYNSYLATLYFVGFHMSHTQQLFNIRDHCEA